MKQLLDSLGVVLAAAPSHAPSIASAFILGGVLYVALTSSSFVQNRGATAELLSPPARAAQAAPITPTGPTERWDVYYLITDASQQRDLMEAIDRDAEFRAEQGPAAVVETITFLLVRNHEEEAWAARLINAMAEVAVRDGYNLKVVDLRSQHLVP